MITRRVNVILAVNLNQDGPMMAKDAAGVFGLHPTAITIIKRGFIELDIDDFLHRKVRETPPREIKITGVVKAHIIALSCQEPPKGYARWTLKLLAKRAVELEYIDSISDRSVRTILNNKYRPHLKKCWCIPPKQNSDFVSKMEDVLEVYSRPYDEKRPQMCMDEKPFQLLKESREMIIRDSDAMRHQNGEYVRCGTCSIFMFTEPIE